MRPPPRKRGWSTRRATADHRAAGAGADPPLPLKKRARAEAKKKIGATTKTLTTTKKTTVCVQRCARDAEVRVPNELLVPASSPLSPLPADAPLDALLAHEELAPEPVTPKRGAEPRVATKPTGAQPRFWTIKMDDALRTAVALVDQAPVWVLRAETVSKKTGIPVTAKQARERWHSHLDPSIRVGNWLPEEDRTIVSLFKAVGRRWSFIARHLEGRPDNAVKNRFLVHLQPRLHTFDAHAPEADEEADVATEGFDVASFFKNDPPKSPLDRFDGFDGFDGAESEPATPQRPTAPPVLAPRVQFRVVSSPTVPRPTALRARALFGADGRVPAADLRKINVLVSAPRRACARSLVVFNGELVK